LRDGRNRKRAVGRVDELKVFLIERLLIRNRRAGKDIWRRCGR
jgi:hypothetical protein